MINHFVPIPLEIILNPKLNGSDIRIYAYMRYRYVFFRSKEKDYYESINTMADKLSLNRKTVMRSLKVLQDQELLYVQKKSGFNNHYILLDVRIAEDILMHKKNNVDTKKDDPF